MKASVECYLCLLAQVLKTSQVLEASENQTKKMMREASDFLARTDFDRTPPEISAELYQLLAGLSGNSDPYYKLKRENIKAAWKLYPELKIQVDNSPDPLKEALIISLAGNVIDFGANSSGDWFEVGKFIRPEEMAIDDYASFAEELKKAEHVVFLGDNAGETVFDRLLIEKIGKKVIYAVREAPVINDATLEEAKLSGLNDVTTIVSSGCRAPGTVLKECSPAFINLLARADLIISKGQGNFECLEQEKGPFYFLLKAKCQPVAEHLGVAQGSLILARSKNYYSKILI